MVIPWSLASMRHPTPFTRCTRLSEAQHLQGRATSLDLSERPSATAEACRSRSESDLQTLRNAFPTLRFKSTALGEFLIQPHSRFSKSSNDAMRGLGST